MTYHEIHYFSPSKINLFLKLEGKRTDGFHDLSSCCQTLNFGDDLFFLRSEEDSFICKEPGIPLNEDNLILKALRLFRNYTGISVPFRIRLKKNIFISAGLGGGSSNAATTLFALNQLTRAGLSQRELCNLGAQLGADVAFFFSKGVSLCEGKGEVLTELNTNDFNHLKEFILFPFDDVCVTAKIYREVSFTKDSYTLCSKQTLLSQLRSRKPSFSNDLEIPVFRLFPKLRQFKMNIEKCFGQENVFLTGSGGTVVCWWKEKHANASEQRIRDYPKSVLTQPIFRKNHDVWYASV